MAIQVLNDQFKAFVSFAQDAIRSDASGKSVAQLGDGGSARPVSVIRNTSDEVHAFFRSSENKDLNDRVRESFLKSVINIFGKTIDDVPEAVQKALNMGDYNKGRPLTARRILAVNESITQALSRESKALAGRLEIEKGISSDDFRAQAKEAIKAGMGDSAMNRLVARLANELAASGTSAKEVAALTCCLDKNLDCYARQVKTYGRDVALGKAIDDFDHDIAHDSKLSKSTRDLADQFIRDLKAAYLEAQFDGFKGELQSLDPDLSSMVTPRVVTNLFARKKTSNMAHVVDDFKFIKTNLERFGRALQEDIRNAEPILKEAFVAGGYSEADAQKMVTRLKGELQDAFVKGFYGNSNYRGTSLVDNAILLRDNARFVNELGFGKLLEASAPDDIAVGEKFRLAAKFTDEVVGLFFKSIKTPEPYDQYADALRNVTDKILRKSREGVQSSGSSDKPEKALTLREAYDRAFDLIKKAHDAAGGDARTIKVLQRNATDIFINTAGDLRSEEKVLTIMRSHREAFKAADAFREETGVNVDEIVMSFCDHLYTSVIPQGAVKELLNAARTYAKDAFDGFDGSAKSFMKGFVGLSRAASFGTGHGPIDITAFPVTDGGGRGAVANLFVRTVMAVMEADKRKAVVNFVKSDVFALLHSNNNLLSDSLNASRTDIRDGAPRAFEAMESFVEAYMNEEIVRKPAQVKISSLGIDPLDMTLFRGPALKGLGQQDRELYDVGMALYSKPHTPTELKELESNVRQWFAEGVAKEDILARLG